MRRALPVFAAFLAGLALGYVFFSGRSAALPPAAIPAPPKDAGGAPESEWKKAYIQLDRRFQEEVLELKRTIAQLAAAPTGEIADPATGAIRVLVLDRDGKPRAGARVEVYSEGGLVTGPDGVVVAGDLPPGTVVVYTELDGVGRRIEATVEVGRVVEARLEEPSGGGAVTGLVRDVEKGPLGGITLVLSQEGTGESRFRTTTAEDGTYRFERVPAGPAEIKPSGGPIDELWFRRGFPVTVPESGTVERDIVVGLVSLRGSVRDAATGEPIADASVTVAGGGYRSGKTDADGVYRIPDVWPGNVHLEFYAGGYVRRRETVAKPTYEAMLELNVELSPAGALRLTVVDAQGRACVGGVLHLSLVPRTPNGLGASTVVTTDDEGRANFPEILPGPYDLSVYDAGEKRATLPVTVTVGENPLRVRLE